MDISQQVCTLEQAKRLKELGVKQDGIATYYTMSISKEPILLYTAQPSDENSYSAFTVAELGELLPVSISKNTKNLCLYKWRRNDGLWFVYYAYILKNESDGQNEYLMEDSITSYNEAQALSDMLIHLLETNLLTPQTR